MLLIGAGCKWLGATLRNYKQQSVMHNIHAVIKNTPNQSNRTTAEEMQPEFEEQLTNI